MRHHSVFIQCGNDSERVTLVSHQDLLDAEKRYEAEINRLTRERDEAQKGRDYWLSENKKLVQHYDGVLADLRTRLAAQERVVEAAKAWVELHPGKSKFWNHEYQRIWDAVDALSPETKAREPRYEVVASSGGWQEGGCVRDIRTQELVFGCWRQGDAYYHGKRCEEECARLNASDAGAQS